MKTVFDVSIMKDRTVRVFSQPTPSQEIDILSGKFNGAYFSGEVVEIVSKEGQEAAQIIIDLFGNLTSGDLVLIGNDIYGVSDNLQAVFLSTISLS